MTDGDIDYKAEYENMKAERDSLSAKLDEYIDSNRKLNADLKVLQHINRKEVGTSTDNPSPDEHKVSLKDAIANYKKDLKV